MININPKNVSESHAYPHTMEKTHTKFQNTWYKSVVVVEMKIHPVNSCDGKTGGLMGGCKTRRTGGHSSENKTSAIKRLFMNVYTRYNKVKLGLTGLYMVLISAEIHKL